AIDRRREEADRYGFSRDEDAVKQASSTLMQMNATEIEGVLTHLFNSTPSEDKLMLRTKCQAQNRNIKNEKGAERAAQLTALVHAKLAKRMKDALVFE
ncbi:unnamed protein product, partial [Prorocentrum cordatum]